MSKRTMGDFLRQAFFAKDKAALAQIVKDAENGNGDEPDGDEGKHATTGTEGGVHVHIEHHEPGNGDAKPTKDEETEERLKGCEDKIAAMDKKLDRILDAMPKVKDEEGMSGEATGSKLPPEAGEGDTTMEPPPAVEAELMEADPVPEQERMRMGDAAYQARRTQGLTALVQDTVARAEVLAPGIQVPTWDSTPGNKQLAEQLCALRRTALTTAAETDAGKAVLGSYTQSIRTMSCDAVRYAFRDASDRMRTLNNERNKPSPVFGNQGNQMRGYRTREQEKIAAINKANAEFWAPRMTGKAH